MIPWGSDLGGCWVSFWHCFWVSGKLDTFDYYDAVVKWPHRGAQEGYLTEVKYPKTRRLCSLSDTPRAGPANSLGGGEGVGIICFGVSQPRPP